MTKGEAADRLLDAANSFNILGSEDQEQAVCEAALAYASAVAAGKPMPTPAEDRCFCCGTRDCLTWALVTMLRSDIAEFKTVIATAEDRAGTFEAILTQVVFLLTRNDPGREGHHPTKSDAAVALSMAKSALAYDAKAHPKAAAEVGADDVRPYLRHQEHCSAPTGSAPCSCGLEALLARIGPGY